MAEKPHINVITAGHVDHGKSTLIGRLLFDSGSLAENELRKLKEKAKELKKETFEFAFVMDNLKEERERGVTIDLMYKPIQTDKLYITIIDCPGQRTAYRSRPRNTFTLQRFSVSTRWLLL